jgi:hypothetical protein
MLGDAAVLELRGFVAVAVLVAATPGSAPAQQPAGRPAVVMDPSERAATRVDPSVNRVVSGGQWKTRTTGGSYRVVEVTQGWETVRYRVFVQWLEEGEDPEGPGDRLKAWRELGALVPHQFSLVDPELSWRDGRWQVTVKAATAPMEQPSQRLTFVLGAPGEVRGIVPR